MSTILLQKQRERTEPKLPSIVNKNLTILPWDWELPSTILMSEWANKHKQCYGHTSTNIPTAFCAIGLLMHYYGWDGNSAWNKLFLNKISKIIYDDNNITTTIGHEIITLNDRDLQSFHSIGTWIGDNEY